jgi:amidophosphoribosyltransferase
MCGIIAVSGIENASVLIYEGLKLLQHRGQESAGILVYDGNSFRKTINDGMVEDAIPVSEIRELKGSTGLGHVRYSTSGKKSDFYQVEHPMQPIVEEDIAIVHNGTLINYDQLAERLRIQGETVSRGNDSDTQLLAKTLHLGHELSVDDKVRQLFNIAQPTYSLIIQNKDTLYVCRDLSGNRPLYIGNVSGGYMVASEERVLRMLGSNSIDEAGAGELIKLAGNEVSREQIQKPSLNRCIIELIYLSSTGAPDEDSPVLFGKGIREVRKDLGIALAREQPANADIVLGVLGSGYYASLGYSIQSGIPHSKTALVRDPNYKKRTFIEPDEQDRVVGVYLKFITEPNELHGKRIAVVDDTIVRLTTSSGLVQKLRLSGASELHMRVASPPIMWPCFYGIDFPKRDELIAARLNVREIEQYLALRFFGMDDNREQLIGLVRGSRLTNEDIIDIIDTSTEEDNYLKREYLRKSRHFVVKPDDLGLERFSLGYLSLEGLVESFDIDTSEYCLACFNGDYQISPDIVKDKLDSE